MDSLCLKAGIHVLPPPIPVSGPGFLEARANPPSQVSANAVGRPSVSRNLPWGFSFRFPLRSLWPNGGKSSYDAALALENAVLVEEQEEKSQDGEAGWEEEEGGLLGWRRDDNWVFKILHVRSLWKQEAEGEGGGGDEAVRIRADIEEGNGGVLTEESWERSGEGPCSGGCDEGCDVCTVNYSDEKRTDFDKESFSKLLRRVSLGEVRLYREMSELGNWAYSIPQIKPENLMRVHGLRYVTSSLEKKEQKLKADKEESLQKVEKACSENQRKEHNETAINPQLLDGSSSVGARDVERSVDEQVLSKEEKVSANRITAAAAYQIAASAASYLHSHTKSLLPFKSKSAVNPNLSGSTTGSTEGIDAMNEEVASVMATTDSVTAVVAAKEEVKQAMADDLKSAHSSPCEWFVCDDDRNATRFFVIQGSESMASWQANLLFEPVQFEGFDVLVHRGIYEAAKGIYEQMLPEVRSHLKSYGERATFRFTGHSLGGSLSLLINLMLLIRGEVPSSSLLPVITFGSPSIMCGGDHLLHKLGLSSSHVKAITMHRDIVPRAFSCNYPNHVAEFLKAVNGNFRSLPCLTNQKLLYAPMGEFIILQPDEKFSPNHHLLPAGSGLYLLSCLASDSSEAERQMQAAKAVFLSSPHPLEILSDRAAYGSGGTIQRDHDMGSYVRSVKNVIREELIRTRKAKREEHRREWWRLMAPAGVNPGMIVGKFVASSNASQGQFNFGGIIDNGKESLKRFGRLVESQHMHLLVLLLFPARLLILGAFSVISLS